MSDDQNNTRPNEGGKSGTTAPATENAATTARVVRELRAAAGVIESGAFDLAGQAHGDAVSDLIRIAADLQKLAAELAHQRSR